MLKDRHAIFHIRLYHKSRPQWEVVVEDTALVDTQRMVTDYQPTVI